MRVKRVSDDDVKRNNLTQLCCNDDQGILMQYMGRVQFCTRDFPLAGVSGNDSEKRF